MDGDPLDAVRTICRKGCRVETPPYLDYDPVAYIAQPCSRCAEWRSAEVRDRFGLEVVREWHHADCPTLLEWL